MDELKTSKLKKEVCVIYVVSNIINIMVYVGQTWCPLYKRFYRHTHKSGCTKLENAINKYGKENFKIEAIFSILTQEDADYYEDYFISKYDSINNGYNLKRGGRNGGGRHSEETKKLLSIKNKGQVISDAHRAAISKANKGRVFSEETRQRQSIAQKGKVILDETRKKISKSLMGEKNPNFGKAKSEETIRKLSAANTGEKNPNWGKPKSEASRAKMSLSIRGENNPISKLNDEKVVQIKRMILDGVKDCKIAPLFNVSRQCIRLIRIGQNWKHIPCPSKD